MLSATHAWPALERKSQENPSRPRKLDGASEAQLIRIACSPPPPGRARWSIALLADKLVELEVFHSVAERFQIHHTPKHGSWLNVAEIFPWILSRESLDQRIASLPELQRVFAAWQASRPVAQVKWRFTTSNARIKLHRLYPSIP